MLVVILAGPPVGDLHQISDDELRERRRRLKDRVAQLTMRMWLLDDEAVRRERQKEIAALIAEVEP